MPFSKSFYRQTLLWTLPGAEKAAIRFHWARDTGSVPTIGLPESSAFALRATEFWDNIKDRYSVLTNYTGSRLQVIALDGTVAQTSDSLVAGSPGTEVNNTLPLQVAVVASLRTALGTRRGRGRVFLPAPSSAANTSFGRITSVAQNDFLNAVDQYCQTLVVGANTYRVNVVSVAGQDMQIVDQVRVGDVFDTQRRRRDDLVEIYLSAAVP